MNISLAAVTPIATYQNLPGRGFINNAEQEAEKAGFGILTLRTFLLEACEISFLAEKAEGKILVIDEIENANDNVLQELLGVLRNRRDEFLFAQARLKPLKEIVGWHTVVPFFDYPKAGERFARTVPGLNDLLNLN